MGARSWLPALLAVWSCLVCPRVSSHPSVLDRLPLQSAASAHDGAVFSRLRRSRPSRSGGGTGRFLKSGAVVPPPFDTVSQLDSVVIECEFQGSPPPTIDWLRDGRVIRKASLTESLEEQTNSLEGLAGEPTQAIVATHARLFLDCMTHRDQAIYTCRAQTPYETKSVSTRLFVEEPLGPEGTTLCERVKDMNVVPARIIQWRSHLLAQMGDPVRLVCETSGFPAPLVTWHKNDRIVTNDDPRVMVMSNGDLIIDSLKWSDMGLYRCKASNEFATDEVTSFLYPFKPEN